MHEGEGLLKLVEACKAMSEQVARLSLSSRINSASFSMRIRPPGMWSPRMVLCPMPQKGTGAHGRTAPAHKKTLHERRFHVIHGERKVSSDSLSDVFNVLVEAGRVELPSEKGPRKASTGIVCVCLFASGLARRRASVGYPAVKSHARPGRSRRTPARWIGASATYRASAASA